MNNRFTSLETTVDFGYKTVTAVWHVFPSGGLYYIVVDPCTIKRTDGTVINTEKRFYVRFLETEADPQSRDGHRIYRKTLQVIDATAVVIE
jgi:hypothetical protein